MEGTINSYTFRSQKLRLTLRSSILLSPNTWGENRPCVCVCAFLCVRVSLPLKPLRLGRDWCIFQPQFHNQRNSCGLLMHHLNFIKTPTPWAPPRHGTAGKRNVYFPLTLTLALCACLSSFSSAYVLLTGSRQIHARVARRGKEAGRVGECQHSAAHRCKPLAVTLSDFKLNSECAVIVVCWWNCILMGGGRGRKAVAHSVLGAGFTFPTLVSPIHVALWFIYWHWLWLRVKFSWGRCFYQEERGHAFKTHRGISTLLTRTNEMLQSCKRQYKQLFP